MTADEGAAHRWARLVRARFDEIERLSSGEVRIGPAFWDESAERYAAQTTTGATRDPLLGRVRRHVGRRTVLVDVGAGPGRFTLALAPRAAEVVAVDVSRGMLDVLRRSAEDQELANVRTVQGAWETVEGVTGDVAICSYVLPIVEDAAEFLRRLDAVIRRRVFLYLGAGGADFLIDPIWRHFHREPRAAAPTYLDAVAVLEELGVDPDVEVVEVRASGRFATLDDAVSSYRRTLLLPDTEEIRDELHGLLGEWLVRRDSGLGSPVRTVPAAIVSWAPGG